MDEPYESRKIESNFPEIPSYQSIDFRNHLFHLDHTPVQIIFLNSDQRDGDRESLNTACTGVKVCQIATEIAVATVSAIALSAVAVIVPRTQGVGELSAGQ